MKGVTPDGHAWTAGTPVTLDVVARADAGTDATKEAGKGKPGKGDGNDEGKGD